MSVKDGTARNAQILAAVDALFDEQVQFLQQLVRVPSQRGEEAAAQEVMADAMAGLGLDIDKWVIDADSMRDYPGFSPVSISYEKSWNVVGTHRPEAATGRSLILNGHIDVVPTGVATSWTYGPL
ncbi:hypothetical protein MTX20_04175 [Bradyrhizobium sp. ISRA435]|nr:hypothetical protein MTX20_04175 [Bradyrhizobium sp. ISRA435]